MWGCLLIQHIGGAEAPAAREPATGGPSSAQTLDTNHENNQKDAQDRIQKQAATKAFPVYAGNNN